MTLQTPPNTQHPDNNQQFMQQIIQHYQNKNYSNCLNLCRKYYLINPNNTQLNNYYKNSIYHLYLKKIDIKGTSSELYKQQILNLFKAINAIIQLTPPSQQKNDIIFNYSIYNFIKTLHKIRRIKIISTQFPHLHTSICHYASYLHFDILNKDPITLFFNNKNTITLPSHQLNAYFIYLNALYHTQNYNTTIQLAHTILTHYHSFPSEYHIWIHRLLALSLSGIQQTDTAIQIYIQKILPFKKDWFLLFELAQLFKQKQQILPSLALTIQALQPLHLLQKNLVFRLKTLQYLLKILHEINPSHLPISQNEHSILTQSISSLLDQKKHLLNKSINIDKSFDTNPTTKILNKIIQNLQHHLPPILNNKPPSSPYHQYNKTYTGKIIHINTSKQIGFIECTEFPNNIFFSLSQYQSLNLQEQQTIQFNIKPSFDYKKQKKSITAINIKILPPDEKQETT